MRHVFQLKEKEKKEKKRGGGGLGTEGVDVGGSSGSNQGLFPVSMGSG